MKRVDRTVTEEEDDILLNTSDPATAFNTQRKAPTTGGKKGGESEIMTK